VILVDLERVSAARPDRPLFEDLSLTVATGDRIGVVGRNGTGKSTLLRVVAGAGEPESGVVRRGRGATVSFLPQRPELAGRTVADAVGGGWEAAAVLDRLGMGGTGDGELGTLSGGQAKRVALAGVLLGGADLLVLDEPTNHLDLDAVAWLEDRLDEHRGGLVLVTHDRHVLDRLTTRVLELDRGEAHVHDGGYRAWLEARAEREERAAAAEATRRILARKELAWLRRGAPARTRKPKARIAAATAVVEGGPAAPERAGELDLAMASTPRLGDKVVECAGLGHRYGDGPWLFRGLDLLLDRRERLGVVGPNGSGKSTMLDVLAGRRAPAAGRVETGPTVRVGYWDQTGIELDPGQRVRDAVAGPNRVAGPEEGALLERFWFDADAQYAPIGTLSGGERRRLQLLLVLGARPNVLLLDEPTNDLDLDTLRALEDFLDGWPGALVVVSHDRAFLERTVEDVLALDGDGGAGLVPGGYASWEEERRRRRTGRTARAARPAVPPRPADRRPDRAADRTPAGTRSHSTLRHLLRQAERDVAAAEAARDAAAAALAAATGSGDHRALAEAGEAAAAADLRLADAEERWLTIAEEAEAARG
jgi:ABC transport system ATP-binding/permease protein